MKSIIFDAMYEYVSNITLANEEWNEYSGKAADYDELILKRFSGDKEFIKMYGELKDALGGINAEETEAYFIKGFSLGMLIGVEALNTLK